MSGRPLLIWTAAFAAGITLGIEHRLTPLAAFCLATLGFGVLGLGVLGLGVPTVRKWSALFPISLLLLGLGAGTLRLAAFQTLAVSDVSHLAESPRLTTLVGTLASDPEDRPGGRITFFLDAAQAETREGTASVTGEAFVTVGQGAAQTLKLDYGDQVRLTGMLITPEPATNPGAFSWRDYLTRRAVYCQMSVRRPGAAEVIDGGAPNVFQSLAWRVRKAALRAIDRSLPVKKAAVLSGILMGRRSDLPPSLLADFVHTGTVHILASAGLHVGILAFWLERLFQKLTLSRKAQAVLLISSLLQYALVCGGRPAVVRAVLMAVFYFGAVLFERELDGPTAVGAAALVILVLQPMALTESGFQLSFLTIGTLALTMPVWNRFWRPRLSHIRPAWLHKPVEWAIDGLGLSLLAQLGALPVTAAAYSEVSLVGWVANTLVVPLLFVLIPLGMAGILLWTLSHALGASLLTLAGWGIWVIVRVVTTLGELPGAYFATSPPPLPLIIGFYALIYGGTNVLQRLLEQQTDTPASAAGSSGAGIAGVVGAHPPP